MERKSLNTLHFEDIGFSYENSAPVFEHITCGFPMQKSVWVRSPGGRGKSTLLKIMAGLLRPQHGRYLVNGEDVNEMSFEEFLPYRLNIGYGFDMGGLLNNKTIAENLSLGLLYHKQLAVDEVNERIDQTLEFFGMSEIKDQRPYAVPGSMRKLACVVRAFMNRPQVVFLDDPLTGLKQDNLNDLIHFVEESYGTYGLKQVFFTSENAQFAEKFAAEELLISCDWFTSRSVA